MSGRRNAVLVRRGPLPVFKVRSASGEPARLVVVNRDGRLTCPCTAATYGAQCGHKRIVARSIYRRTGIADYAVLDPTPGVARAVLEAFA